MSLIPRQHPEYSIESFECIRCQEENHDLTFTHSKMIEEVRKFFHYWYYSLNPAYSLEDYDDLDWMQVMVHSKCNYCNYRNQIGNRENLLDEGDSRST